MSSYLEIAERVLAHVRRPLSAREIMKTALLSDIVPSHLHGRAQHKTLHARLAEDIAGKATRSRFYRTEPGKFFLADLKDDPGIPVQLKLPFFARPRIRDLGTMNVLTLKEPLDRSPNLEEIDVNDTAFVPLIQARASMSRPVFISFCVMVRDQSILLHTIGGYRAGKTALNGRTSIGFGYPILEEDVGLFSESKFGIRDASINGIMRDFGLDDRIFHAHFRFWQSGQSHRVVRDYPNFGDTIVYLTFVRAPADYDPTLRKLAINDLRWESIHTRRNTLNEFDPWSEVFYPSLCTELG